ncbi:Transforming growth factor beta regulator 4 [Mactra antiquata]
MSRLYQGGLCHMKTCLKGLPVSHLPCRVSMVNAMNVQSVLRRCLADSLKSKRTLKFDLEDVYNGKTGKDKSVGKIEKKVTPNIDDEVVNSVKTDILVDSFSEAKEINDNNVKLDQEVLDEKSDNIKLVENDLEKTNDKVKLNQKASDRKTRDIVTHLYTANSKEVFKILTEVLNNPMKKNVAAIIMFSIKRLTYLDEFVLPDDVSSLIAEFFHAKSDSLNKLNDNEFRTLLSFLIKGNKEDSRLTLMILHEACWRMRKSNTKFIMDIYTAVKKYNTTEKRREVLMEAEKKVNENLSFSSPDELLEFMYTFMNISSIQHRIEEELSVMLYWMDPKQTASVLFLLAKHKSKNGKLIYKTKDHLVSRPIALRFHLLAKLFYACDALNIFDEKLLNELSSNAIEHLNANTDVSLADAMSLLISCSRAKWGKIQLVDSLMNVLGNNLTEVLDTSGKSHLAHLARSAGYLNLLQHKDISCKLTESLQSLKTDSPFLWLDIIHSLAYINSADVNEVQSLLQEDFYQPLLESVKGKWQEDIVQRKLLSLYGYLQVDKNVSLPNFDGQADIWRQQLQEKSSRKLVRMSKPVGEVLSDIAPLEKYTRINVVSKYGYNIDFELFVDDLPKAVKLDESDNKHRVWIKVLDFNDFVKGNNDIIQSGNTAMAMRHLNSEKNVHIIYVTYLEWNQSQKKHDQLHLIESKIKTAVETNTKETGVENTLKT